MSDQQAITILDGGMGRELKRRGAPFRQPEWSALAMIEAPDIVTDVHKDFIRNGSQVITTNSYSLVPFHIGEQCFTEQAQKLADLSGAVARKAVLDEGKDTLVAGSVPPLFGSYRAELYQPERVAEIATPLIKGLAPHIDIWLSETQSLIAEAIAVRTLINELDQAHKPFWVSFTLEDSIATDQPRLRSGESVKEAVEKMIEIDVTAILFNCSQPEVIEEALQVAKQTLTDLQAEQIKLGAYANAFPPQPKDATANEGLDELREDLNQAAYVKLAETWQTLGATLIGGCCGIGPKYINALSKRFSSEGNR